VRHAVEPVTTVCSPLGAPLVLAAPAPAVRHAVEHVTTACSPLGAPLVLAAPAATMQLAMLAACRQ
jgi:hypothetical protein